jgi:hypothetical protein
VTQVVTVAQAAQAVLAAQAASDVFPVSLLPTVTVELVLQVAQADLTSV